MKYLLTDCRHEAGWPQLTWDDGGLVGWIPRLDCKITLGRVPFPLLGPCPVIPPAQL
jgi:hypothetical protein